MSENLEAALQLWLMVLATEVIGVADACSLVHVLDVVMVVGIPALRGDVFIGVAEHVDQS